MSSLSLAFLAAFLLGLALAVYVMLHGVERRRTDGATPPDGTLSARLSLPSVAGFAAAFGATGYLLLRESSLGPVAALAIAAAAGAAGATGALTLVTRWAIRGARTDDVDVRYLLQGHLARVTRAIGATEPGAIVYEIDGRRHSARACTVEGTPLAAETDVVIERVENEIAFVEPWTRVEQRL
jgi:hypothetical protein